jgi:hypothetical protein
VTGYDVLTSNGRLGHVEDLLLDDESWQIRYVEVDTRNWWPGKKVLVAPAWIEAIRLEGREIYVSLTRDAVRGAPEYDPSILVTPEYERRLFEYYSHASGETENCDDRNRS